MTIRRETLPGAPLVSVIVPAYNAKSTIENTIASALNQTLRDIEIIIVNDGSTDSTGELIDRLARNNSRISAHHCLNSGHAAARNRAVESATGRFLAPLDADDIWHPAFLEKLSGAMLSAGPEATLAYSYVRRIDEHDRVTETKPGRYIAGNVFHQMLAFNVVGTGSGVLLDRAAVIDAGGYERNMIGGEDYLMQLRMAWRGLVVPVPEYLVGYRTTPGSLSTQNYEMSLASKKYFEIIARETPGADRGIMATTKARIFADAAIHAFKSNRLFRSLLDIILALAANPAETIRSVRRKSKSAGRRYVDQWRERKGSINRPAFYEMDPLDLPKAEPDLAQPALLAARAADARFPYSEIEARQAPAARIPAA